MADRSYRRWGAAVVAVLTVCLVGCGRGASAEARPVQAAPSSPSAAASPAPGSPAPVAGPAVPDGPLRVLQLNLCNSGIAGCYTGRSVPEAAAVLRAEAPDLVTLNEICEDDVGVLERALAGSAPGGAVASAFQPHRNGSTGQDYRCRNGQRFGLGLLSRGPAVPGSAPAAGVYPVQDPEDPEQRAWVCLDVVPGAGPGVGTPRPGAAVTLCTTHLAYTKREVARAQCAHLFDTVVAEARARTGAAPVVVGADLNLGAGNDPDLRACLPAGSARVDDGGQQHLVGSAELAVAESRRIPLRETDHPGLFAAFAGRDES